MITAWLAGVCDDALPVLLDVSVKGSVVLGLAVAASVPLRRAAAATRHLLWAVTVVGLVLLGLLSVCVPAWRLRILPRWADTAPAGRAAAVVPDEPAPVPVPPAAPPQRPSDVRVTRTLPQPPTPVAVADAAPAAPFRHADVPVEGPSAPPTAQTRAGWPVWIMLTWLAGAGVLLAGMT